MAFKNFLIVASKLDAAGINITTQLSQFRSNPVLNSMSKNPNPVFDFYLVEEDILHEENIDLEKINKYDFIIFASKHSSSNSEKREKTLSVHAPGNFITTEPALGGKKGKISLTSALFLKYIFELLNKNAQESNLTKHYQVTLEATHHGPLINKPSLFIEIGSTGNEWKDNRAGFIVAKTIKDAIETFRENPYHEIAIAIGGPHYCPNFNKIQLKSNFAISHIIPQYVLPLTEEMLEESIKKTFEEIDLAIIDWKGLGNSESRQQVLDVLNKHHFRYERSGEIKGKL